MTNAYGTPLAQDTARYAYTANGQLASLTDAAGNRTSYGYDGFDRLRERRYPSLVTPGSASPTDYEQYGYDVAGNVVLERRRGGAVFGYGYDALNQAIGRDAPGTEPDTVLAYDNFGRVRSLSRAGQVLSYGYDGLGRLVSEAGPSGGIGYGYDAADRRIRLSWPDGQALSYSYDQTGAMTRVDGPSGALIAQFSYDDLGRRGSLSRANGAVSVYGYDGASRLISLRQDFPAAADMVTQLAYNPASQAVLQDVTPSSYAFAQGAGPRQSYASNGLNQYAQAHGEAVGYNANGAQTSRGARSYGYDAADRLIAANAGGGASLSYDPAGRLGALVVGGQETRFLYDGAQLAAEANAGGTILRRI